MKMFGIVTMLLLGALLLAPIASANVVTTTMTWFVASARSISVSYGSPCTSSAFFFVETNAQYDPDSDGNAARVVPSSNRIADANCQSSSQASMVVSNTGTGTLNVDANFATAFAGADTNVVLKVWQGTGTGCGTFGLGGWEATCSVVTVTSAPNTTTCRNFNEYNDINGARVITSLAAFAAQQLCYSGDFNGFVSAGDHNGSFQLGSDFS